MSAWIEHDLEDKLRAALARVDWHDDGHHFGRPFMTAYQLAIEFARLYPDTVSALGMPIGGAGTGQRNSLSQYISLELSKRIKADPGGFSIEGGFLSNQDVDELRYVAPDGSIVTSSLTGSPFGLSMFRLRDT